jgi:hypothetical protein
MSGYSGRNGVNVSQYVANLNTIPSPQDTSVELANHEEDFSAFMNTEFFDIGGAPLPEFDLDANSQAGPADLIGTANGVSEPKMDLNFNSRCPFMFTSRLARLSVASCRSFLAAHCSDVVDKRCISPQPPPDQGVCKPRQTRCTSPLPHALSTTQASAPYTCRQAAASHREPQARHRRRRANSTVDVPTALPPSCTSLKPWLISMPL